MSMITVYLNIEPEIESLLLQQNITLENLVHEINQEINLSYGKVSFENEELQSKDILPIIVASSAGLTAVLFAISNLLDTYFHRPHHYEWDELEELRENGVIVKDALGNPVWKLKRHHELISPQQLSQENAVEFEAGINSLVLRVLSSKK